MKRTFLVGAVALAAAAEQKHGRSGHHAHGAGKVAAHDVGIKQVVTSLGNIISGIDGERDAATKLTKDREGTCKTTAKDLKEQLRVGGRTVSRQTESLEAITAAGKGLKAALDETKGKIASASKDIDGLVARLKTLREDQKKRAAASAASLQQVDVVIAQTTLKARSARAQRRLAQRAPKRDLEALSKLGGELASSSSDAEEDISAESPASFVQTAAQHRFHKHHSEQEDDAEVQQDEPALIALQADKKQLQQATSEANDDFDKQEKELLDMIRLKREELKKLEAQKEEQQPQVADKLKKAAETQMALKSAQRGVVRDEELKKSAEKRCELNAAVFTEEDKLSYKLVGQIKMAKKMLESMSASMLLQRDMQALRGPAPAFLQVASSETEEGQTPLSFVQESQDSDSQDTDALIQRAQTAATSAAGGAFDEVSQMIQALITSLKQQANEDLDKHQFCMENTAKNRKQRLAVVAAIDVKGSEIHWAETAVAELKEQVTYLEKETARLRAAATNAQNELKSDEARRGKTSKNLATGKEVIARSMVVLTKLCDLKASASASAAASFLQVGSEHKGSQCAEAAKILKEAMDTVYQTEKVTAANLEKIQGQLGGEKKQATDAADARQADLLQAKSSLGRRGDELAAAKDELASKKSDLALVEKAQAQLETNCGPKQETHEERQARRADEIEALKNALSVLEGESIPVA